MNELREISAGRTKRRRLSRPDQCVTDPRTPRPGAGRAPITYRILNNEKIGENVTLLNHGFEISSVRLNLLGLYVNCRLDEGGTSHDDDGAVRSQTSRLTPSLGPV